MAAKSSSERHHHHKHSKHKHKHKHGSHHSHGKHKKKKKHKKSSRERRGRSETPEIKVDERELQVALETLEDALIEVTAPSTLESIVAYAIGLCNGKA